MTQKLTHSRIRFARSIALLVCLLSGIAARAGAQSAEPLPVIVPPTDFNVRYIGRFDTRDSAGPRCAWSASTVQMRFSGSALNAKIKESGHDLLQIVIDGRPGSVVELKSGADLYRLADKLEGGDHRVDLVKRTEAATGTIQFLEFQLADGSKLLPMPERAPRRIEVIGDSITCGYGNEGKSQNEHFSPATENAYLTYGAIAARALDAEYVCIAWSGRKMAPDNTMAEVYDRALPQDSSSSWDFDRWIPDVVIINLATNDFGKDNPEKESWTKAYEAFIARLRKNYPKAEIYCATGSMMTDSWPPEHKALSTLKAYLKSIVEFEKQAGDAHVRTIDFEPQDQKNGLGSDWHPNVKTHEIMAAALVGALQSDLGWRRKDPK
jgi:lysophospholipase L1-like esterase